MLCQRCPKVEILTLDRFERTFICLFSSLTVVCFPPNINMSQVDATAEGNALRMRMKQYFGQEIVFKDIYLLSQQFLCGPIFLPDILWLRVGALA